MASTDPGVPPRTIATGTAHRRSPMQQAVHTPRIAGFSRGAIGLSLARNH